MTRVFPKGDDAPKTESFEEVLERRLARRSFIKGALAGAPLLAVNPLSVGAARPKAAPAAFDVQNGLTFTPISLTTGDAVTVPPGYDKRVLARWGDPISRLSPLFNINAQSPYSQARQIGYNCDFLGFFPLPSFQTVDTNRAILTINHEYTNEELMFPGYDPNNPTRSQVDIAIAAHGLSVVEIVRTFRGWEIDVNSRINRRITGDTAMEITGPAAGHPWLRSPVDPTGTRARGMLNNCGGGKTPWGTLLTAEENFNQYFANYATLPDTDARKQVHLRYGLTAGATERKWERYHRRFDVAFDPNEPFRFGWVVEIDPYDARWVPKKRTALGRLKHEAATFKLAANGSMAVYTGDDERFEHLYKFVPSGRYNPTSRQANFNLLDSGTLYAAKFNEDGTGQWIPLVYGTGALVPPLWNSQGDILVNTRLAGTVVGATKMDRPEDIQGNPANGKIYGAFTNNTRRAVGTNPGVDKANPRPNNRHGHVIEITETNDDPTSLTFTWEIFILAGNPANGVLAILPPPPIPTEMTYYAGYTGPGISPIASPDNVTFDNRGNLWIASDGLPATLPGNDGIFAVPTAGPERGYLRQFLSTCTASEVASLEFSANADTLFVSVQHPGEGSTLAAPSSHWPDGGNTPPRPSVVAVTKTGGGPVGS